MDEARFQNPKAVGSGFGNAAASKGIAANNILLKPPPLATPILDRFKAMLKEREDEVRVSDDRVVFLSSDEVIKIYEVLLSELTFNSKPIITDLTIIAGDQSEHGEGIADAICARILEVPVEQKLPSLYLLDSIVKNIGRDYVRYFSSRLPEVFCEAYRQVHPNMYPSMRNLYGTWSNVFPSSVLRRIEASLKFSPPSKNQSSGANSLRASESPRPTHSIHVNPKYLEARRQFGDTAADAAGGEMLSSRDYVGDTASDLGSMKPLPSSATRIVRASSPYGATHANALSPPIDDIDIDASPRRGSEKASPSHSGFSYGYSRASGRHADAVALQRNILPEDTSLKFETSAYRYRNGIDLQRPRALIDAYGMDEREKPRKDKHLKIDHPNVNGIHKNASFTTWQNTEEEEFNWEDMAPASGDSGRSNDLLPPNIGKRSGFGTFSDAPLRALDFRSNWSKQSLHPPLNGTTPTAISPHFSIKAQIPISGNGMPSSAEQKLIFVGNFANADARSRGSSVVVPSMGPSFDSLSHEPKPPVSVGLLASVNMQSSYHQPPLTGPLKYEKFGYQPEIIGHQGMNIPKLSGRELGAMDNLLQNQVPQYPNQHHVLNPPNLQVRPLVNGLQSQEARQNMLSSVPFLTPSQSVRPIFNHGYVPPVHSVPGQIGTVMPSLVPRVPFPSTASGPAHLPGVALPPFAPGFPPASSAIVAIGQNPGLTGANPPTGVALSGLFDSLMAQGLISLTNVPKQDSVDLDFNPDLLKARHESAITALYADLPRQCTACGLRFKSQEAHSSHMDWHVTRNRNISKNRKQRPSRKWFVNVETWLSSAETLGADAAPGVLPVEDTVERNDDEEMAVPANDDQKVCALCGETFEDFYSDETEEWMYKGAVYLNAPTGSISGMDRSHLGPIVHAKCRSETGGSSAQNFQKDEEGYIEDGSDRKRLRR